MLLVVPAYSAVSLYPPNSKEGYVARLLLNEVPFPGERGWISEADTKAAMASILWVLHARIEYVPRGYSQTELATIKTNDILDVITAGGIRGQCDGFYRDSDGNLKMVTRIPQRIDRLLKIANTGSPGRFARLMEYGQRLTIAYFRGGMAAADRFVSLERVGKVVVTGRAYSWMANQDFYHPGGDYIKIPDADGGALGGNRFSTLRER